MNPIYSESTGPRKTKKGEKTKENLTFESLAKRRYHLSEGTGNFQVSDQPAGGSVFKGLIIWNPFFTKNFIIAVTLLMYPVGLILHENQLQGSIFFFVVGFLPMMYCAVVGSSALYGDLFYLNIFFYYALIYSAYRNGVDPLATDTDTRNWMTQILKSDDADTSAYNTSILTVASLSVLYSGFLALELIDIPKISRGISSCFRQYS